MLTAPGSWVGPGPIQKRGRSPRGSADPLHSCFGQIILALGNYMNSSKRGAVYGFKLQSLDLVR